MLRILLVLLMGLFAADAFAESEEEDCQRALTYVEILDPTNPATLVINSSVEKDPDHSDSDHWFIQKDSIGVRGTCRNQFNTFGARMAIQRTTTDPFTAQYTVSYAYCTLRTFGGGCDMTVGSWSDKSSKTFEYADVGTFDESTGRKTLGPTWVCLKRYAPGDTMRHKSNPDDDTSNVNNSKFTKICAYSVLSNCTTSVTSWQHDWFGCVDVPFMPRPVTYNKVIPSEISPIVDPRVKLEDYTDANGNIVSGYITMGSVFDQPLIKLINAYDGNPEHQLILRYKFPGDTDVRQYNDYPSSGTFTGKTAVYQAVINPDDPSQVCACKQSDCASKIYAGCTQRPTPYQSNLAVVAVYQSQTDSSGNTLFDANDLEIPTVSPEFAITDAAHQIMYYDQDGTKVYIDPVTKNAFKTDASGVATTTPANGKITYKKLALPATHMQIREYYAVPSGSYNTYIRDTKKVYGIDFSAMIPTLDASGNPIYKRLDLYPNRYDRCNIVTFPSTPNDSSKPLYFNPGGQRDRTYCACPSATVCPAPQQDDQCNTGGAIQYSDQEALKVYCPGVFEGSEVNISDKICLVNMSGWDFNSSVDSMCTKIIMGCPATELEFKNGYVAWPKMDPNTTITGTCDAALGFDMEYTRVIDPFTKAEFYTNYSVFYSGPVCTSDTQMLPSGVTCATHYANYMIEYNAFKAALDSAIVGAPDRNLAQEEVRSICFNTMPNFNTMHNKDYSIHTTLVTPIKTAPVRTCTNGKSTVTHPCKKTLGCVAVGKPVLAFGYIRTNRKTADGTNNTAMINGSCPTGYTSITTPMQLQCVNRANPGAPGFYYNVNYWVDATQPMCRKN